ncbi:EpsG family protein [Candidatus Pacearchaeota archaeon]|nr:EpsG family protein [Candidatus Pacearchaeota archaeon]
MKNKIREIPSNTFYQLLIIYTILIIMITLSILTKYTIHMEIFALVIGIFGFFIIKNDINIKENDLKFLENKYMHYGLLIMALLIIFLLRAIPYMNNQIPLGYDTGMYKYAIESGLTNLDKWVVMIEEPGFLYLMSIIKIFLPSQFILTWLFILFNALLGFAIYLTTKEYFNKTIAIFSVFIYTFSIIQFKVFEFMYYRNILGITLALFAFYFMKKDRKYDPVAFAVLGIILAGIHKPTFYLFGLSYFFYSFISPIKNNKTKYDLKLLTRNVIIGVIILIGGFLFYLGNFTIQITNLVEPVLIGFVSPGESPGTFITFFQYQFTTLIYLPFALIGFIYLIKKKEFNVLFFWTLISAIIVYFQFFFFNRFIIFLDVALIILASAGIFSMINDKKRLGGILSIILVICLIFSSFSYALNSKPNINVSEFNTINKLAAVSETNAFVMTTSSLYSPWLQGYSDRKTIAPGLFDYDLHTKNQWNSFWASNNQSEIVGFISEYKTKYNSPIYIFIGEKQKDNIQGIKCTTLLYQENNNKIYRYEC